MEGWGLPAEGHKGTFLGGLEMLYILIGVLFTCVDLLKLINLYKDLRISLSVHFTYFNIKERCSLICITRNAKPWASVLLLSGRCCQWQVHNL